MITVTIHLTNGEMHEYEHLLDATVLEGVVKLQLSDSKSMMYPLTSITRIESKAESKA